MSRAPLILTVLAILLCAASASHTATLNFGGLERTYRLYRPAGLARDAAVPLVLVLHGGFGTGAGAERAYHWDETADAHGFVVLYPDGIGRSWNAGACCGPALRRNLDDIGFLEALIEHITNDEHIDLRRIYVTGISNGAMMTYRLACESHLKLAALGPVAGTFSAPCKQSHPTSVLAIHGLDDRTVPFAGGVGVGFDKSPRPAVSDVIARWRAVDHCAAARSHDEPPVHYEISTCEVGRTVELVTIAGAGHQWPGSETPPPAAAALLHLDQPSRALDATALLWSFFAAHRS